MVCPSKWFDYGFNWIKLVFLVVEMNCYSRAHCVSRGVSFFSLLIIRHLIFYFFTSFDRRSEIFSIIFRIITVWYSLMVSVVFVGPVSILLDLKQFNDERANWKLFMITNGNVCNWNQPFLVWTSKLQAQQQ